MMPLTHLIDRIKVLCFLPPPISVKLSSQSSHVLFFRVYVHFCRIM